MKTFALATLAFAANAVKLSSMQPPLLSAVMDQTCQGDAVCAFDFFFFAIDDNVDGNISVQEFNDLTAALVSVGEIDPEDAAEANAEFVKEAGADGAKRDEVLGWLM